MRLNSALNADDHQSANLASFKPTLNLPDNIPDTFSIEMNLRDPFDNISYKVDKNNLSIKAPLKKIKANDIDTNNITAELSKIRYKGVVKTNNEKIQAIVLYNNNPYLLHVGDSLSQFKINLINLDSMGLRSKYFKQVKYIKID